MLEIVCNIRPSNTAGCQTHVLSNVIEWLILRREVKGGQLYVGVGQIGSVVTLSPGSWDNAMRVVELSSFRHSGDINFSKRAPVYSIPKNV